MKIDGVNTPNSSFLSMEKDMSIIVKKILENKRIQKLLYYTDKDPLSHSDLTDEQVLELFGKNIKSVPKLLVDESVLNYIFINFDNFTTNQNNPQFRDNLVEFDIVCHFSQWQLKDFQMRPYRIAAEIDSMLNNKRLTGIGLLQFEGAVQVNYTDELCGVCLLYRAIHGGEDKVPVPWTSDSP
jgi:hypothetical protein